MLISFGWTIIKDLSCESLFVADFLCQAWERRQNVLFKAEPQNDL